MVSRVGIEAIAVAIPRRFLAIEDLAIARGVAPTKLTVGLGAREMAVPDPGEDTVALAATAASRLLRANDVDRSKIGMLVVGTETGVDHSKPVASFVQGLLDLPKTMRTYDAQHACYGGTAALMAAGDWIASGAAGGRSALVICSDIARYGIATPGEPTQGGGAVAMLVSDRPRVLQLDHGVSGVFSTNVHDFWRPLGRREALVDGHYSIVCYLDALAGAYGMWRKEAAARGLLSEPSTPSALPSAGLARIAYHVPFCKMAKKAHARLRRLELEELNGGALDDSAAAREESQGAASFDAQVAPSLLLPSRVGNTYTGSLYLGLASLLHTGATELIGKRVGLFSYGSGCASEMFSGVVGEDAAVVIARAEIDAILGERTRIDVAEYERLMNLSRDEPPAVTGAPGTFRFTGVHDDRRTYAAGP